jgi:hypothetical protein
MKLQIIETPDYILAVSDEEIKKDDIIFYHHPKQSFDMASIHKVINPNYSLDEPAYRVKVDTGWGVIEGCKKIIAYKPKGNAPELDLPLLPDVEDDVQNFIVPLLKKKGDEDNRIDLNAYALGLIDSYKATTKVYSEDAMIGFAEWIADSKLHGYSKQLYEAMIRHKVKTTKELLDVYLSLKQPKTPKWFVAEMETSRIPYGDDGWKTIETGLKTKKINGKTYLVGTYLYE